MSQDLAQKIAFITGASSGIGLATARAFAAQGARLLLAARRQDRLESERAALAGAGDVHTLQLDVTNHAAATTPSDVVAAPDRCRSAVMLRCPSAENERLG